MNIEPITSKMIVERSSWKSHMQDRPDLASDDDFWKAVLTRDARYHSSFVFGVTSTGVYCRPTCSSRRPRRNNVVFFSRAKFAKQEGFRPCLRCKPDDLVRTSGKAQLVEKACNYIQENYSSRMNLAHIGREVGVSPFHLQRIFKQVMGVSPREYLESVRLSHMRRSLKRGISATKSTYSAGYNTSSWLYTQPDSKFGMSPATYKLGGDGLAIRYIIADCSLGRILVAGTARGICSVCLGDSDEKLVATLNEEYPKAEVSPAIGLNDIFAEWVSRILEYLEGVADPNLSSLPLDIRATAFQRRVWQELQRIPYGKTASYSEVAKRLGVPSASRAVANACASNPTALVIPCHRVVRKDGELGGYHWGLERKRQLLQVEGSLGRKEDPLESANPLTNKQ